MNTNKSTLDSTTDHRQDDCRCPDDRCAGYHHPVGETCHCTRVLRQMAREHADSFAIVDGGVEDLGFYFWPGRSGQQRVARKTVLSHDGVTLTHYRDSSVGLLDTDLPEVPPASAEDLEWMALVVGEKVALGMLSKDRENIFIEDLKPEFERLESRIVCPPWCKGNGKCYHHHDSANVEHVSKTQRVKGDEFSAKAAFEMVNGTADYRNEAEPLTIPQIEIDAPGRGTTTLTLEPSDLSKLGKFLIAQAERFTSMMREVGVAA